MVSMDKTAKRNVNVKMAGNVTTKMVAVLVNQGGWECIAKNVRSPFCNVR